mgnify:CR=1 FL=1
MKISSAIPGTINSAATRINESLEKDGHEAWYDVQSLVPGDDIQAVIERVHPKVTLWLCFGRYSLLIQAALMPRYKQPKIRQKDHSR